MAEAKLKTNLDTDFIKLIAIISMTIDHIGAGIFPQFVALRWIGRIAFPLFCYCLTVGLLYTHDIKNYILRLGTFALISQPFYILAFNSDNFWGNIFNFNIFFTLTISLVAMWGLKEKKWLLFFAGLLLLSLFNFDYSITGVELMMIFYLFRNNPLIGAAFYVILYVPSLFFASPDNIYNLTIGTLTIGFEAFCYLAMPFIYFKTNTKIKISKWFFYWFYPAHLIAIYLIKLFLY